MTRCRSSRTACKSRPGRGKPAASTSGCSMPTPVAARRARDSDTRASMPSRSQARRWISSFRAAMRAAAIVRGRGVEIETKRMQCCSHSGPLSTRSPFLSLPLLCLYPPPPSRCQPATRSARGPAASLTAPPTPVISPPRPARAAAAAAKAGVAHQAPDSRPSPAPAPPVGPAAAAVADVIVAYSQGGGVGGGGGGGGGGGPCGPRVLAAAWLGRGAGSRRPLPPPSPRLVPSPRSPPPPSTRPIVSAAAALAAA